MGIMATHPVLSVRHSSSAVCNQRRVWIGSEWEMASNYVKNWGVKRRDVSVVCDSLTDSDDKLRVRCGGCKEVNATAACIEGSTWRENPEHQREEPWLVKVEGVAATGECLRLPEK